MNYAVTSDMPNTRIPESLKLDSKCGDFRKIQWEYKQAKRSRLHFIDYLLLPLFLSLAGYLLTTILGLSFGPLDVLQSAYLMVALINFVYGCTAFVIRQLRKGAQ